MKGSKELIEHYNKREEELGEKATKLNMYLEGYAEGYRDTKSYMIDKACEYLKSKCDHMDDECILFLDFNLDGFRKAMEE